MASQQEPGLNTSTPLVLLGGMENTLSVTRSMGRLGVQVYVIARDNCAAHHSRFCTRQWLAPGGVEEGKTYRRLLLDEAPDCLQGAVVLPCSDVAISFIAAHDAALRKRYILDCAPPEQQLAMLDKQETLSLAHEAGCPVPGTWRVSTPRDLEEIGGAITFPVLIKPIISHLFQQRFGVKLFVVETPEELQRKSEHVLDAGLAFMICEFIPGPDSLLNSCYTYVDGEGKAHFVFTKRILRRSPRIQGSGCMHATQWLPETAEMGMRFFEGINFRGIGNVEFKRDERDGQLKVIECNARFTGCQALVVAAGIDLAQVVYRSLTGQAPLPVGKYRDGLFYWNALADWDAFRELRRLGEITWGQWLRSLLHPMVFPYFSFSDPKPFLLMTRRKWFPRIRMAAIRLFRFRSDEIR